MNASRGPATLHQRTRAPLVGTCVVMLVLPVVAGAQESRFAQIAALQAAKAAKATPAALSSGEQRFIHVKNDLTRPPSGFFPAFGDVLSGGGWAVGPGYRYIVNGSTTVIAKGLWSVRNYRQVDAVVGSRGLAGGMLDVEIGGGWRTAPSVAYYGLGMTPAFRPVAGDDGANDHGRASYSFSQSWGGGVLRLRPAKALRLAGGLAVEHVDQGEGNGGHPSIEERFTEAQAPGLGRDHTFVHSHGMVGIDWRPAPGYARRGGAYTASLHDYRDTGDAFSFRRLDAEVVQHLPLLRESFIFSVRGRVQSILGDDDVPFYLLPTLGGGSSLRGFPTFRFSDRHSMLMSAEYRWIPNRAALDAAIFVDSGKVASSRSGLDFDGLKTSVGFGLRLHTPASTILRLEVARSNEGLRVILGSSAAF